MNEETDPYQHVEYLKNNSRTIDAQNEKNSVSSQKNKASFTFQNSIDISYKNITPPGWMKNIEIFCQKLLKALGINNWELSILFCDDTFIRELNQKYRAKNSATDVLAFPGTIEKEHIKGVQARRICAGDIVISLPTLIHNAYNYHIHREEELRRLVIHGVLHLSGMDHTGDGGDMLLLQEKLLKDLKGGYD